MLKLYFFPGACSLAPHILLEETGLPYKTQLVRLPEGEQQKPEYLGINPKGRVPALDVRGEILTELPAISYFIAQQVPEKQLWPKDAMLAARCLEWFNWLSGSLHAVAFGQLWRPARFVNDPALHPQVSARGMENVRDIFAAIEGKLAGRTWAVGDAYSVVDPYLTVFFRWGSRIKIDMAADYPAWAAHASRVEGRPAVQRVLESERAAMQA